MDSSKTSPSAPGLTPHFISWLNENGYSDYKFERPDLAGGSYGGKENDEELIENKPIIFIHGNGDMAMGTDGRFTGFTRSINYLRDKGYKKGELYATTWGTGDKTKVIFSTHN